MTDTHRLAQLAEKRSHVLQTVSGLTETAMSRALIPSGWAMTQLLNHLAFDVESFWISAVLGGDPTAIAALHDGWASAPMTGADAIRVYEHEITRSIEVLAQSDLNAPPRWWPAPADFEAPPMTDGREIVFRVLVETSIHAGHLDIVRDLTDGHQNLVLS